MADVADKKNADDTTLVIGEWDFTEWIADDIRQCKYRRYDLGELYHQWRSCVSMCEFKRIINKLLKARVIMTSWDGLSAVWAVDGEEKLKSLLTPPTQAD